ncbi:MAG: RNA polymerase sigma factor [Bacteroidota bacterium]
MKRYPDMFNNRKKKQQFLAEIERHQEILHSLCRAFFQGEQDREDARQEILYQLWKSYPQFRGEAKFSTWMYKVALNTLQKLGRKKQGKYETDFKEGKEIWDNRFDQPAWENTQLIAFILQSLSPEDKSLVILKWEGYSYKEIGEILGVSSNVIGTRLHRIKKHIQKHMAYV